MKKYKIIKYKTEEYSLEFIQKNLCDAEWVFFFNDDAIDGLNISEDEVINDLEKYDEYFSCYPFFDTENYLINKIKNPILELTLKGETLKYYNMPSPELMVIKVNNKFDSQYKEFFLKDALQKCGQDLYRYNEKYWDIIFNKEYINKTKTKEYISEANHFFSVNTDCMKNTIEKIRKM